MNAGKARLEEDPKSGHRTFLQAVSFLEGREGDGFLQGPGGGFFYGPIKIPEGVMVL